MASEARIGIRSDSKDAERSITSVRGMLQKLGSDAKSSILAGVGLGAGISAFNVLSNAVRGTADALGGMVQSAIDDETSVTRLTAALHANVPGWDGNTEAIERTIEAGQRLGFTDDDTRASLAFLTAATHDATRAQELHGTAMDLARFKGIDLQTASEALVRVEGGRFRILAGLGIKLRDGATATEALAAVQAVAAGQAEKFGDTTAGAMKSAQIAIEEAGEAIGRELLPVVKELAVFARDKLVPAIRDFFAIIQSVPWGEIANGIGVIVHAFNPASDAIEHLRDEAKHLAEVSEASGRTTANNWIAMGEAMQTATEETADGIVEDFGELPGEMADAMLREQQKLTDAAAQLVAFTAEALSPAQVVARDIGFLTSTELAAGLVSDKPLVVTKAEELRDAALTELNQTAGAYSGGSAIAYAWINGMLVSMRALRQSLQDEMSRIKRLYGGSLPTAGPLQHPETGGASIAKAWLGGMVEELRGGLPLPGLNGNGASGFASGLAPAMAGVGGGGGGDIHTHVYLNEREIAEAVTHYQNFAQPGGPARLPR